MLEPFFVVKLFLRVGAKKESDKLRNPQTIAAILIDS
jgi:hypothetical protein